MITLAFYKGGSANWRHRVHDACIRFATGGRYSHVELIGGRAGDNHTALCFSSSGRDGGVRPKLITLTPEKWDLVHLPIAPAGPVEFICERIGAQYDFCGLLLSHVLALGRHDKRKWFCSEIVAAAIGMPTPQRFSPQMLHDVVTWRG